jgi:outer membrane lipoprotein-sorting protein
MALGLVFSLACVLPGKGQAQEARSGAAPSELSALMDYFASSGTVRADFKETRRLSLLTDAIETEGVLYFAPPDRLARQTTRPGSSRVIVHDGRVAIQDETGTRAFDLGSSEIARSLIGNLIVLLRGDLPGLRERYTIEYTSDGQRWRLDLKPRSKALRVMIEGIRFSGAGWTLEAMETRETNGDISLSVFSGVETQLVLTQQEFERIFSLDLLESNDVSRSPRSSPSPSSRAPANP